jgi:hypothetical protein
MAEQKHPLQMNKTERKARHKAVKAEMDAIEAELTAEREWAEADPVTLVRVQPERENRWAHLDTERRELERLGI